MDLRLLLDIGIGGACLGAWFAVYGLTLLVTRPRPPHPGPATQELGQESPAVVSLLVNSWDMTEDAAESTLLDLAARRVIELRQPGNDPMQTTVHIREPDPTGLTPYERQVFDRIAELAVEGVVPVTALTFRDKGAAKRWSKRLRAAVVAEARERGLSRRRFGTAQVSTLTAAAAVTAVGVGLAGLHYDIWAHPKDNPGLSAGFLTFFLLTALAGRPVGERDTPSGRQVASRWLGVRAWLHGHEQFDKLPPASVAVWDRYLAYGAATGTTHLASRVLNLGMGNRRRVWSSYGGGWHRVRVRYPIVWRRYGHPAPILLLRSGLAILAGAGIVRIHRLPADFQSYRDTGPSRGVDLAIAILLGVGLALLAYGGYTLARTIGDLAAPRTLTGEVLWIETWRRKSRRNDSSRWPWLHYLAIDDDGGDRTTAWGLPSEQADRLNNRDLVTVRVRPWSRRVIAIESVRPGTTHGQTGTTTAGTGPAGTEPAGTEPAGTGPAKTEPAGAEPAEPTPAEPS